MADDGTSAAASGTRRQLALIGGGALLLAITFMMLWYFVFRTTMVPAFSDLKPADAALIVDELKRQKTPYELADDGKTIRVPTDQVNATRVAILGGDLPLKGTVGFELFSKSDMGLTEFAQKINYRRALQGELARTLMSMSTIDSARIHLTLPETGIFQDDQRVAKASVTITPKFGTAVEGHAILGIQRLVASAVENLDAAQVVVLDDTGRQLSSDAPLVNPAALGGGSEIERSYADQVRSIALQLINDPTMQVTVWAPPGATIEPAKPGEGAGSPAPRSARRFPLRITLALSAAPEADLRDRLVPLLQALIGFDVQSGDSLMLITQPPAASYQVAPQLGRAVSARAGDGAWDEQDTDLSVFGPSDKVSSAIGWIGILALLAVACFGAWQIFRRRRDMALGDRQRFAARLRELLDEDERLRDGSA